MKYAVLAALLFIAGISLAWIERPDQQFTPVIRVRTENGLFMTFLLNHVEKQVACMKAVKDLTNALHDTCPACAIESTDCPSRLHGMESAMARKEPAPLYVVAADELRIGIVGPPASVRARCEQMASIMSQGGLKSAACIPPAAPF